MGRSDFNFENSAGQRMSGVLELGDRTPPLSYAVFAHCFTCDKSSLAAARISRALADKGIGVLRFDFTGLGESEGDFVQGLSSDIQDIISAAEAMSGRGMTPNLLVGHSFGGAAVLAAANSLPEVRAIAVIGAPFDADHVLAHLGTALGDGAEGPVPVSIGGREFRLGGGFLKDIMSHNQGERIAELRRALLVMHSPVDEIVSIDNASKIFLAARHPKSFVSLDDADHLLLRDDDATYAAEVIAAWAARYLNLARQELSRPEKGVRVEETGAGKFQVRVVTPSSTFISDEPAAVGGLGSGPTPYDLLSAGLGACTAMTCRLYADRKSWPLDQVVVEVGHRAKTAAAPDVFVRRVAFRGNLDEDQQTRLLEIAERCPVHRTLTESASVETQRLKGEMSDEGAPDNSEDHVRQMEETCAAADDAKSTT